MTRDEISMTLTGILGEIVPELEGQTLDPAKTYQELGVNSLDLVTFAAESARRLNVKIPREQLAGVNDLNGLTGLFEKALAGR